MVDVDLMNIGFILLMLFQVVSVLIVYVVLLFDRCLIVDMIVFVLMCLMGLVGVYWLKLMLVQFDMNISELLYDMQC